MFWKLKNYYIGFEFQIKKSSYNFSNNSGVSKSSNELRDSVQSSFSNKEIQAHSKIPNSNQLHSKIATKMSLQKSKLNENSSAPKVLEEQKSINKKKPKSFFSFFNIFSWGCKGNSKNVSNPTTTKNITSKSQFDRYNANDTKLRPEVNSKARNDFPLKNRKSNENNYYTYANSVLNPEEAKNSEFANKQNPHHSVVIKVASTQKSWEVTPDSDPNEISESNSDKSSDQHSEEPHTNENSENIEIASNSSSEGNDSDVSEDGK